MRFIPNIFCNWQIQIKVTLPNVKNYCLAKVEELNNPKTYKNKICDYRYGTTYGFTLNVWKKELVFAVQPLYYAKTWITTLQFLHFFFFFNGENGYLRDIHINTSVYLYKNNRKKKPFQSSDRFDILQPAIVSDIPIPACTTTRRTQHICRSTFTVSTKEAAYVKTAGTTRRASTATNATTVSTDLSENCWTRRTCVNVSDLSTTTVEGR